MPPMLTRPDIEEYLPYETRLQCEEKLNFLSFLGITSQSYTKDSVRIYKHAYVALYNAVYAYILLGAQLLLAETVKPTKPKDQQINNRLLREEIERLRKVNAVAGVELPSVVKDAGFLDPALSSVLV